MANFPTFNADPRWFPMPTLQQGSPFGGILSDAISKRLAMANAQKAEGEAPYAGLSSLAGSLSKSAYAANVPVQSLVKTMMNSKQWASMTETQRQGAIDAVYNNAARQGGLSPIFNDLISKELSKLHDKHQQPKNSFLDTIKSAFGLDNGNPQSAPQMAMPNNNATNASQNNDASMPNEFGANNAASNDLVNDVSINGNNAYRQPPQNNRSSIRPVTENIKNQPSTIQNEANYEAILEQEKAKGRERGKNNQERVTALGDELKTGLNNQTSINEMKKIVTSPIYEQMRQVPAIDKHEIGYYKKFGNADQKALIGNLFATQGQMIQNFVTNFKGSAMKSELDLAEKSKVNEGDALEVAKGKIESLDVLNRLNTQRAYMTSTLMDDFGMSYADAQKEADKRLRGEELRKQVHDELFPSKQDLRERAKEQGYNVEMLSPPDKRGNRKKALVHGEDVDAALKEGWSNA